MPSSSRLPAYFRRPIPGKRPVRSLVRNSHLYTVCEEAICPNRPECFSRKEVTFLLNGNICTRGCPFCGVNYGEPFPPEEEEPERVARIVRQLGLRYVVLTAVTRDDLIDGGAGQFVRTIRAVRAYSAATKIEVLLPDFQGQWENLEIILAEKPAVVAHNLETVSRLTPLVRRRAEYKCSLELLAQTKRFTPLEKAADFNPADNINGVNRHLLPLEDDGGLKPLSTETIRERSSLMGFTSTIFSKSGLMLGMGERKEEVIAALEDLRDVACDLLTLGQYLSPSARAYPRERLVTPEEFAAWKDYAINLGFKAVSAGSRVRSSYQAEELWEKAVKAS